MDHIIADTLYYDNFSSQLCSYLLMMWSPMRDIWIFDVPAQIHFSFNMLLYIVL